MKKTPKTAIPRRARVEETRPKNGGVHTDQLKRVHTKHNRRAAKQQLRQGAW